MEEKNKKIVIAIIAGILVIAVIALVGTQMHKQSKRKEAEKQVEQAKEQLNEAMNNLKNNKPNYSNNAITNENDTEVEEYINKYFSLEKAKVDKSESTFDEMSLTEIKVKNNGDKTIKKFTVTVYFQDEEGKDIAEDSVNISEKLKPNYSWQLDSNRRYGLDNIPEEASKTRAKIAITDIEFE